MKRKVFLVGIVSIALVFGLANIAFAQQTAAGGNRKPDWVQKLPQSNDRLVYFVGKSEKRGNYENYLEAKAGALMSVLTQFLFYKRANVEHLLTDYTNEIGETIFQEAVGRISSANGSAGLYQQAEWMAEDGTLYALYTFSPMSRTNPRPDLPEFFRNLTLRNDRIYFVGTAVSPRNNNTELTSQAEQSAKMQALLYLGGNLSGLYSSYVLEGQKNGEFFEAAIKITSRINLQSLSFQEEARQLQKEGDQQYHYYGLYSISSGKPGNIAEYECFTYNTKYGKDKNISFEKSINFNGSRFSRNRPYTAPQVSPAASKVPVWVTDSPSEGSIWGIGSAKNSSVEIQNIWADLNAVISIAWQMQAMLEDTTNGSELEFVSPISSTMTDTIVFGLIKINEASFENPSSSWVLWQASNPTVLDSSADEAFKRMDEALKRMEEAFR